MRLRKVDLHRAHFEDLRIQGIDYQPLVWSCWGREHEDTSKILRQLARSNARRRGDECAPVLTAMRHTVCAALARRSAAMVLSCMPRSDSRKCAPRRTCAPVVRHRCGSAVRSAA